MRIFKYDVFYDNLSPQELELQRLYRLKQERNSKINVLLGIKDEGEIIIENRERVMSEILSNTKEKGFLSRVLEKLRNL